MAGVVPVAMEARVRDFLLRIKFAVATGRWLLAERDKNLFALSELDLVVNDVPGILQAPTVWDYVGGPLADDKGQPKEWWVFGPAHSGKDLYVKISLNGAGYCEVLSMHLKERKLTHPLRREKG